MAPVLQLKMDIMNNPVEGASAEEQALFDLPVQVMGAFLQGGLSDEVMNFYKLQIQKMPQHTYRAIQNIWMDFQITHTKKEGLVAGPFLS